MKELSKNKVILGLSGGVDSTTAALMLKEKGLEVIGYYFDCLGDNQEGVLAARKVADQLGIKFIHEDVSKDFSDIVIDNFCTEYNCGRTPNPCVMCNPNIKFKRLIKLADQEGAYYIATGHYARIFCNENKNLYYIMRGESEKKDQSYMLYRLGQEVLSRLIFPLGEFENKEKTRNIAREHSLINAEAADSQEICFIDEEKENYVEFIEKAGFKAKKGDFIDEEGKVLGQHQGLIHYTLGQRKGLGITLGKPAFVTKIDPINNTVTLGDNEDLFNCQVYSKDNHFAAPQTMEKIKVLAKIRYAAKPAPATISFLPDGRILTIFDQPQRAATPGQSIVFYEGNLVIGGGFIDYE